VAVCVLVTERVRGASSRIGIKDAAKPGVAMAAFAEPVVRIRLAPAESPQTTGSSAATDEVVRLRASTRNRLAESESDVKP